MFSTVLVLGIHRFSVLSCQYSGGVQYISFPPSLKAYKNENFFGSDLEFCTVSLLVMLNIKILAIFFIGPFLGGATIVLRSLKTKIF